MRFRQRGASEESVVFLLGIFSIAATIWLFDINPFSNEITQYIQSKSCSSKGQGGTPTECQWVDQTRVVYKINFQAQSVIFWSEEESWPIQRLDNCVVKDRKNWSCISLNEPLGFRSGKYFGREAAGIQTTNTGGWWAQRLGLITKAPPP